MGVIVAIIIIALLLGVLGVLIEGLLWLLFIGIALLVAAFVFGAMRGRSRST